MKSSGGKERRKSRSAHGRNKPNAGEWDQLYTLDHTKKDPLEEQFFQKNKIYNNYMKQAGQKLKDANKRLRFGKNDFNPLKQKGKNNANIFEQSYHKLASQFQSQPVQ